MSGYYQGDGFVEVFSGDLGGGKTLGSLRRMFEVWDRGGIVATNVDVIWPECKDYARDVRGWLYDDRQLLKIPEDRIGKYHEVTPPGSLIVLEEVHLFFNAREWQQANKECLDFLTQARKYDNDIIFITQHPDNFDKQSRRIVRYFWWFTDMQRSVMPGVGIASPFPIIVAQQFDRDRRSKLDTVRFYKDPRLFKCYRTKGLHGSRLARAERPQVEIRPVVPVVNPRRRYALAAAAAVGMGIGWGLL